MGQQNNKKARQHIREEEDGSRQFVFHPEEDELFTRTGKQVIAGGRLTISIEVWFAELRTMFDHVVRWIQTEGLASKIAAVDAVPRGAKVSLFFVVQGESYDFDLSDRLAELNRTLVTCFNIGMIELHQLPGSEVSRFLDPEKTRRIYGDAGKAHQPMEA